MGFVCALLAPGAAAAEGPPEKRLETAESEFRLQRYRAAADILKPLLHPRPTLGSPDDIHHARELLGATYWHLKEMNSAEREWQYLLLARPAFQLDEFLYPRPMRATFERLRTTLIQQGIIVKVEPQPENPPPTVLRVVERVEHRSRAIAFMPFGVPQFEQGATGWGVWFATSQGLAGLASLGTYSAAMALRYANSDYDRDMDGVLLMTSALTGAAFYVLATWGIIDANVRHEPSTVVTRTETVIDTRTVDVRTPQPQRTVARPMVPGGSR